MFSLLEAHRNSAERDKTINDERQAAKTGLALSFFGMWFFRATGYAPW